MLETTTNELANHNFNNWFSRACDHGDSEV